MHPERDSAVREQGKSEEAMARFREAQVEFLESRRVLNAALRDATLAELPSIKQQQDPVDWLRRRLRVETKGNLMKVSLTGGTPMEQVALVNGIVAAYVSEIVMLERLKRHQRFDSVKQLFEGLQASLREKRAQIASLDAAAGLSGTQELRARRPELVTQQLSQCASRRLEAMLLRTEAEVLLRLTRENSKGGESTGQQIAQLEERIAVLTAQEELLDKETARLEAVLAEPVSSINREASDVEQLGDQVAHLERATRKLSDEIARNTLELEAPDAVVLLEKAE
jgi:uncharacterized protein YoxC